MKRKIRTDVRVHADAVYLTVTDPYSGRANRFTVHKVSLSGLKRTRVIGRELDLRLARRVVASHIKFGRWVAPKSA